jgi:methylated-DNA-[protein]-cysteine S-methyltransferase
MNVISYPSPFGMLRIAENGAVITSVHWAETQPAPAETGTLPTPLLQEAVCQLSEYFAGKRRVFDLPLARQGTDFQLRVWQALRTVPYGETRSYRQIAEMTGCPKGARAVGLANNRNPLSLLTPCHRVIGADSRLVGYAGGLEIKRLLLEMERSYAG